MAASYILQGFLDTANLESIQQCKKNTLMLEVLQQTQA